MIHRRYAPVSTGEVQRIRFDANDKIQGWNSQLRDSFSLQINKVSEYLEGISVEREEQSLVSISSSTRNTSCLDWIF